MVAPLREYFGSVEASDVHDYGAGFEVRDYLFPGPLASSISRSRIPRSDLPSNS
jgi:hypothetical protein